jgi:hypothetical protein
MQGIFFSELVEMVESMFSPEMADAMLDESALQSQGIYTAGGTYDHQELLHLVDKLSEKTDIQVEDLMNSFGNYLFERLSLRYPEFLEGSTNAFEFLSRIEDHIHTEVRKIYPESELATFNTHQTDSNTLLMTYTSQRPFGALALGLLQGCCRHFGEPIEIFAEDMSKEDVNKVLFTLKREH